MLPTLLPALVLALPQSTPRDLVHQWRLVPDQLQEGSLVDSVGDWHLKPEAEPGFHGEAGGSVLRLKDDKAWASRQVDPKDLPDERFSVEAWVYLDRVSPYSAFLGAIEDNGDYERGFLLGTQKDRFVFAVSSIGLGKLTFVKAPGGFQRGRWYHVAGVYDGEAASLFVDGAEVAYSEEPAGPVQYHTSHQLTVGAYKDSDETYPMGGMLAEVRLYDDALRGRDIARRASKGLENLPDLKETTDERTGKKPALVALQPRINTAISKGVSWLLDRQHRDGSWDNAIGSYKNGQTALTLYTLLKSGLSANHPSVKRGFDYLARRDPTRTYSAGCQLLALMAAENPEYVPWAERIVDDLIEWESAVLPGSWAYPTGGDDLSNVQFAALGLWAASEMGIKIPKAVWQRMVETTIESYSGPDMELPKAAGQRGKPDIARGFTYYPSRGKGKSTGSMTAAGLCVMGFAQRSTKGKLGVKYDKLMRKARPAALDWLTHHWSISSNPNHPGRVYYYLYGLERVGALLEMDIIGGHDWYLEGATHLVDKQNGAGTWGSESDTCFAILFLVRATGPITGGSAKIEKRNWSRKDGPVRVQINGDLNLTMFLTGFDKGLLEKRNAQEEPKKAGLRIAKVEWLVNDEVVASMKADPMEAWTDFRYPNRWKAPREKTVKIKARVHVVPLGDYPDSYASLEVLESLPLDIPAKRAPEEFARQVSKIEWRNLLLDQPITATASSFVNDTDSSKQAADGLEATSWLCAKGEAEPWIRLEVDRPVRARELTLSAPNSSLARANFYDAPTKVRIKINGKKQVFEADLNEDDLLPTVIPLPKRLSVRSIEVQIIGRRSGTRQAGITGFAEVALR